VPDPAPLQRTVSSAACASGAPTYRRFRSAVGEHLLIVPYTRIYDLPETAGARVDQGDHDVLALIDMLGFPGSDDVPLDAVHAPDPHSISLNVSSSCNLSCSYCYASRGGFQGAQSSAMTWPVARTAIDRLFATVDSGAPLTIGFLGGEPFVNRALIHQAVAYADSAARRLQRRIGFSVTTNGTLLSGADIALLQRHRFAVTVSIDGGKNLQNAQRPRAAGRNAQHRAGSFDLLCEHIAPLLAQPGLARIGARATVLPDQLNLAARLRDIVGLGFAEVGFSPLKSSPSGLGFDDGHWTGYLESLTALAHEELQRALAGEPIRLTNFAIALKQLHRGAASPYPCGAGGGYFSVDSKGDWYACHRAIGDAAYRLGDAVRLDQHRRGQFLRERHVHSQTDCSACWARYLCSGGCHQEAAARSVAGCNFIRGWLDFCLKAYCELSASRPNYFDPTRRSAPEVLA
jgi:uncharacterized protein